MRSVGELQVSGSLLVSGSDSQILGNLDVIGGISASTFNGDGSGLSGLSYYTDDDNQAYLSSLGVISSSTQIASDISGAFTSISESLVARTSTLEEFSSSLDTSFATDSELINLSTSLASDINTNDVRLTTLEGKTLISSSDQITITEAQISDLTHYTDSDTLDYLNILGIVSGSSQISYTGITDIPNGIVSSSAQLSDTTIPGSLTVGGILTAQEFHTEFVSASIIYESGSTQFGNSLDDVHNFSGSLAVNTNNLFVSGGRVGIGTTAPGKALEINGSIRATRSNTYPSEFTHVTSFTNQLRGSVVANAESTGDMTDGFGPAITFQIQDNTSGIEPISYIGGFRDGSDVKGGLSFWTATGQYLYSERLTIKSNGNVGIGTSIPSQKLDVIDLSTSSAILVKGFNGNIASSYKLQHGGGGGRLETDGTWSISYGSAETNFGLTPNLGGGLVFLFESGSTYVTPMALKRNGNALFSSNVGIGTAAPSTKLEVKTATDSSTSVEGLRIYNDGGGIGAGVKIGLGVGATYSEKGHIRTDIVSGGAGRMFFGVNGSDVITVDNLKNVGIGTTSPSNFTNYSTLSIDGTNGGVLNLMYNGTNAMRLVGASVLSYIYEERNVPITISTNSTERMRIDAGGNVGIGTTSPAEKLHVVGNIVATGNITGYYSSDERLKENKEVLKNPIEKINKISGYEFDWKEIPSYGVPKHDVGVIAQEIEEVLPEIVARREDGYLAVRYEKIVPLLIEGIKELSKEVESLKDIIKNNGITK